MSGELARLTRGQVVGAREVLIASVARGEHVHPCLWEAVGACEDAVYGSVRASVMTQSTALTEAARVAEDARRDSIRRLAEMATTQGPRHRPRRGV